MRIALLAVLLLTGCATRHGGMGHGEAPGGSLCRTFDARDFYLSQSGVSAGGDLLIYSQPSVDCGQRPAWRSSRRLIP